MTQSMTLSFEFVDTLAGLESLGSRLGEHDILAIDIEADSLHHYRPKVCLIQISSPVETCIVDPLATRSIEPIIPILGSQKIKKIFHGADYDLRSLYRDYATEVRNVFDTMVGSQFLGEKEVGLAAVLNKRFGLNLDKKYQKANWSKRPLPRDMLLYAAHDTAHLIVLYHQLARELAQKKRLQWVEEECERLSVDCSTLNRTHWACSAASGDRGSNTDKSAPLFRRFKGAGAMPPRDLAILEKLLVYREKKAMQQDRPPFKVFGNKIIRTLVDAKPTNQSAIKKMPGFPDSFVKRYAKGALLAINKGLAVSDDRLPVYPKRPRRPRDPARQARLKRLKHWRDSKARQWDIAPGLLCSNGVLNAVAEKNCQDVNSLQTVPDMRNWQHKVLGDDIISVMAETDT